MLRFADVPEVQHNMIPGSRRDKFSVPLFVVLTFVLSWTCWFLVPRFLHVRLNVLILGHFRYEIMIRTLLSFLGAFIPGLVALTLSTGLGGSAELLNLLKRLNPFRPQPRCYVFAILIPLAALFTGACMNIMDTGTPFALPEPWPWIKYLFTNVALAPLWEELGWRGFLLPRLQATRSGFHSSMLIGLIWGIWHFPLKRLEFSETPRTVSFLPYFCMFCVLAFGLSVILTWLYNISQGAIVPCIIFHAVFNAANPYFVQEPSARDGMPPLIWASLSVCLVAVVLLFLNGENLARPSSNPISEQKQITE
jgi:uncharacterized protein